MSVPDAGPQKKGTTSRDGRLEAVLQRRVGDVAGIGDLMARVLRLTLAQGTRCREKIGKHEIARHAKGKQ
jgi:hypothetical protein